MIFDMANVDRLTREVNRILEAPYVVSLKALFDIVRDLNVEDIQDWALVKPCQSHPLAFTTCRNAAEQPFITPIHATLAQATEFRDALLQHDPAMLEKALVEVCQSSELPSDNDGSHGHWCLRLSVTLLSSALPQDIALPASFSPFLQVLVQRMIKHPSLATIQDVYRVICGVKAEAFGILPEHVLLGLSKTCRTWISKLDEHMSSMLCIAIAACFLDLDCQSPYSSTTESPPAGDRISAQAQWILSITEVFTDHFITKTLDLIVVRVILLCSDNNSTKAQTLYGISLARAIVGSVKAEQLNAYLGRSSQKFAKLNSKIASQPDVDIRLETISFCISAGYIQHLSEQNKRFLQTPGKLLALYATTESAFEALLAGAVSSGAREFRSISNDHFVSSLLQYLVDLCRPGQRFNLSTAKSLRSAVRLCGSLRLAIEYSEDLRNIIVSTMNQNGIPDWWDFDPYLLSSPGDARAPCPRGGLCSKSFDVIRHELARGLSKLLLKARWQNSADGRLSHTYLMVEKLFNRLEAGPEAQKYCEYSSQLSRSDQAVEKKYRSPDFEGGISRQWDTRLSKVLQEDANVAQKRIISFMQEVCQDLERRCETLEEPLRAAEARYLEKENDLQVVTTQLHCLEEELRKEQAKIAELETVVSQLQNENKDAEMTNRDTLAQLHGVQTELETCKEQGESRKRELSETREQAAAQNLQQEASLIELREVLAQEQDRALTQIEQISKLEGEVQNLEKGMLHDRSQWDKAKQELENQFAAFRDESEAQKAALEDQLRAHEDAHSSNTARLREHLDQEKSAAASAAACYQSERNEMNRRIRQLVKECNMLKHDLSNAQDLKAKLAALMSGHVKSNAAHGWSPEPNDDSFDNDTSAPTRDLFPGPDQASPVERITQYHQVPSRQGHLRTPKSTFDQGLSHVRESLPAARRADQSWPVRRTLSSLSPNKNAASIIRRQSHAVLEGVNHETEADVRRVSFKPDVSFDIASFDENDDLLTNTEPGRPVEDLGEGESIMTVTEL